MDRFEVCIVGAGVIGLAIARSLSKSRDIDPEKIVVIESESAFGNGISSRNSEVIHAGIYYPPGSLKAKLCIQGKQLLYEFLQEYKIGHRKCGKLIVAQKGQENALEKLLKNASESGLSDLRVLNKTQISHQESQLSACSAIYSPSTGIIDSHHYMHTLQALAQNSGVIIAYNSQVSAVESGSDGFLVSLSASNNKAQLDAKYEFVAANFINCAGLKATEIASKIGGLRSEFVPKTWLCKGDYFSYEGSNPFKHLIYPIPEENTVGLGIHSTLDLQGQLKFGPDAYYLEDEDYDLNPAKAGHFAALVKHYFPAVDSNRLYPAYSGIRPKLSGPGQPSKDFMIQTESTHGLSGLINLFGIESPGLTASLAIGEHVRSKLGAGV